MATYEETNRGGGILNSAKKLNETAEEEARKRTKTLTTFLSRSIWLNTRI
jgi:hypothetical protein